MIILEDELKILSDLIKHSKSTLLKNIMIAYKNTHLAKDDSKRNNAYTLCSNLLNEIIRQYSEVILRSANSIETEAIVTNKKILESLSKIKKEFDVSNILPIEELAAITQMINNTWRTPIVPTGWKLKSVIAATLLSILSIGYIFSKSNALLNYADLSDFKKENTLVMTKILNGNSLTHEEYVQCADWVVERYEQKGYVYSAKYFRFYAHPELLSTRNTMYGWGENSNKKYPVVDITLDWEREGFTHERLITVLRMAKAKAKHYDEIIARINNCEEALILLDGKIFLPMLKSKRGDNSVLGDFSFYAKKSPDGKTVSIYIKDLYDWNSGFKKRLVATTDKKSYEEIMNSSNKFQGKNNFNGRMLSVNDDLLINIGMPYILIAKWDISYDEFLKYFFR